MIVGMASPRTNNETVTNINTTRGTATPTTPTPTPTPTPTVPTATRSLSSATMGANSMQRSETPKSQRGQNKPKCVKCGNVARSRCPFNSCKSCCSKAQNLCHIHVIKSNGNHLEKAPPMSSPSVDRQQSTEVAAAGNSNRVGSFQQPSNSFAQINNVHIPLRSRRPLTRKDAAALNEWRFSKLKEYKEGMEEWEDEGFHRYMRNNGLLEEVFCVHREIPEEDSRMESKLIGGWRKKARTWNRGRESVSMLEELIEKVNKARNEEDLKSCLEMKCDIFRCSAEDEEGIPEAELTSGKKLSGTVDDFNMCFGALERVERL